jgi:hypothetical protein
MNRKEILTKLINMEGSIELLIPELSKFDWDSAQELIILKKCHILKILNKFIEGLIKKIDIEIWAETIECREDIGFEALYEQLINQIIYELANPYLVGDLSKDKAKILIENLI